MMTDLPPWRSLLLGAATLALAPVPAGADGTVQWRRIERTRSFAGWRAHLRDLVERDGVLGDNHLCIVVAVYPATRHGSGVTWAYLHWRERAELYTIGQSDAPMSDRSHFKSALDLRTDVVASEDDVGGSSYLVTRRWLKNVLGHCARTGTRLVLRRRTAPAPAGHR